MADRITYLIPPNRNVVFVGHEINYELRILQAFNFKFPYLLSNFIDTDLIATEVFWGFDIFSPWPPSSSNMPLQQTSQRRE